ncbi:MAG: hypothetical protein NT157_03610, partial [Candidatus Micrarchaeota archaeon]|nr:hypothetical protein [Candidatus Micrarchaeota archaeon]
LNSAQRHSIAMDFKRVLVFLIGLAPRAVFSLGGEGDMWRCAPDWVKALVPLVGPFKDVSTLIALVLFILGLILMLLDWHKISKNKDYEKSKYGILLVLLSLILFFGAVSSPNLGVSLLFFLAYFLIPFGLALVFSDWQKISKKEYAKLKYGAIMVALGVIVFFVMLSAPFLLDTFACF